MKLSKCYVTQEGTNKDTSLFPNFNGYAVVRICLSELAKGFNVNVQQILC